MLVLFPQVRSGEEEWLHAWWVRATGQGAICTLSGYILNVLGDKGGWM